MRNLKRVFTLCLTAMMLMASLPTEVYAMNGAFWTAMRSSGISGSSNFKGTGITKNWASGMYWHVARCPIRIDTEQHAKEDWYPLVDQLIGFDNSVTLSSQRAMEGFWALPVVKDGITPYTSGRGGEYTIANWKTVHDGGSAMQAGLRAAAKSYYEKMYTMVDGVKRYDRSVVNEVPFSIVLPNKDACQNLLAGALGGTADNGYARVEYKDFQEKLTLLNTLSMDCPTEQKFLENCALIGIVARAGGQESVVADLNSVIKNFMEREPYQPYFVNITPCVSAKMGDGTQLGFMVACDDLTMATQAKSGVSETNAIWSDAVTSTGAAAHIQIAAPAGATWNPICGGAGPIWGNSIYEAVEYYHPETMSAPCTPLAMQMVSIFPQSVSNAFTGLYGGTWVTNSTTASFPDGRTATHGCYWLGTAGIMPQPGIPTPVFDDTGKASIDASSFPPASYTQGIAVSPKDVVTDTGSYSTNMECTYTIDFNPAFGLEKANGKISKKVFQPAAELLGMVHRARPRTDIDLGPAIAKFKSFAGTSQEYHDALELVNMYPYDKNVSGYNPKLVLTLYGNVVQDTGLEGDEAAELAVKSAGYYGNGVEAAYSWGPDRTGDVIYNPSTENLDKASRGLAEYKGKTGCPVSGAKATCAAAATAYLSSKFAGAGTVTPAPGDGVQLTVVGVDQFDKFYNIMEAMNWKLSFDFEVQVTGNIDLEKKQAATCWGFTGGSLTFEGPAVMKNVHISEFVKTQDGEVIDRTSPFDYTYANGWSGWIMKGISDLKQDYLTISGSDKEHPRYYSELNPDPHVEMNQGTIREGATGPTGSYNSMTGTPTTTFTERNTSLNGWSQQGTAGHYYQYFAAGGSEFVIEFDGEVHKNESATRTFKWDLNYSGDCGQNNGTCAKPCGGHPGPNDSTITNDGDDCACPHTVHDDHGKHFFGTTTVTTSVMYTGLSYVEITNLKVWQLSEARVDGTRDLLETDTVKATVQSKPIGISYNIAGANTAKAGRMVYKFCPDGAGAGGDPDNLYWSISMGNPGCGQDGTTSTAKIKEEIAKINLGAYMVSDYIVLHTSDGNECVLYYEQESVKDETMKATVSIGAQSPVYGTSSLSTSFAVTNTPIEFTAATDDSQVWSNVGSISKGKGWTSEKSKFIPAGVTYGGYNGNYNNRGQKYKSSEGNANDMSWADWTQTQAYQNKSKVFDQSIPNTRGQLRNQPSKSLRLMADGLEIPDDRTNGLYEFHYSDVFYKNLVWGGRKVDEYPTGHGRTAQPRYGGQVGFVLKAGYANSGNYQEVCNGVVVYNPISNENAVVISLPEERDQRYNNSPLIDRTLSYGCPGDETCEYQVLNAHTGQSYLHNENCFVTTKYTAHTGYNAHVHNDSCASHMITISNPAPEPYADGSYSLYTPYCWYQTNTGCGHDGEYAYSASSTSFYMCHSGWERRPEYDYKGGGGGHGCDCYHCDNPACGDNYCSNHRYECSPTCDIVHPPATQKVYDCGDMPKNTHKCVSPGEYICSSSPNTHMHSASCSQSVDVSDVAYDAYGTDVYSFTATSDGTIRFYSTTYSNDPRGRLYINGREVIDDDDSGGGYNFDTGVIAYSNGDKVVCNIYQYGSSGAGTCTVRIDINGGSGSGAGCTGEYNTHVHNDSCAKATLGCYTTATTMLTCTDPHHYWDSCWKIYTLGLLHIDGTPCGGYTCSNTSNIQYPGNRYFTVSQLSNGHIVKHSGGQVHLSLDSDGGICTFCNMGYIEVMMEATASQRPVTTEMITNSAHYDNGDTRCWHPCMNKDNHSITKTATVPGVGQLGRTAFINLDYQFTICFPNNGDFYGTGRQSSLNCSGERGMGYGSNMDTTEWISNKWVIFPFDVTHKCVSYKAGEKIPLTVYETFFEFYCVLENSEARSAEVIYGTTAINDPSKGVVVEASRMEATNTRNTTYRGRKYAHPHDADNRSWVDVVGRIGALTMNDVGDFRYSNFFKKVADGWLVPNMIRRVNTAEQFSILTDPYDIRGHLLNDTKLTTVAYRGAAPVGPDAYSRDQNAKTNTYGTYGFNTSRDSTKIADFPLRPSLLNDPEYTQSGSNQKAAATQPMRIGYTAYMDFMTLGNYYGVETKNEDGSRSSINYCNVQPHYFRVDIRTGQLVAADAYMVRDGQYVLINDADRRVVSTPSTPADECSNLNWTEEANRRNYFEACQTQTDNVYSTFNIGKPAGTSWLYGTYDDFGLMGRNRTGIGTKRTYSITTDPSSKFPGIRYNLQGARWHFGLGVPSSTVFVKSGDTPTQENIDKFIGDGSSYAIAVTLEIYAMGDVWNLVYDGKHINKPFRVTPNIPADGNLIQVHVKYPQTPGADPTKPGTPLRAEEMPLVSIISLNHSSKEDINQAGTH